MGQTDGSPAEASVLRVLVPCDDRTGAEPGWTDRLPPVPPGRHVTASFTSIELLRDLPQLEARGYTFVGVHSATLLPPGLAAIDLLVPADLARENPGWWDAIARCADRAFPLVFGPARKLFGELVEIHRTVPQHAGT